MNIHEYQAKEMFREFGVRVQEGIHCKSVSEALAAMTHWDLRSSL